MCFLIIICLFSIWITVTCHSDSKYICECAHSVRKEYVVQQLKTMPEVLVLVKKNRIIIHAVAGKNYFQLDSYRCITNKKFIFH